MIENSHSFLCLNDALNRRSLVMDGAMGTLAFIVFCDEVC